MEREEAKFKRDMEAQDAERARAEAAQARREKGASFDENIAEAEEERQYFEGLLDNFKQKLDFFDALRGTFEDDEYGNKERAKLDEKMARIYDMEEGFRQQFQEVDNKISDLNFEKFI